MGPSPLCRIPLPGSGGEPLNLPGVRATGDEAVTRGGQSEEDGSRAVLQSDLKRGETLVRDQLPLAQGLVRLEDFPLDHLIREVDRLERYLQGHSDAWDGSLRGPQRGMGGPPSGRVHLDALREHHHTFRTSSEQVRWFLDVVLREDHGGHRQALGQYWRLVVEALEWHLAAEREFLFPIPDPSAPAGAGSPERP